MSGGYFDDLIKPPEKPAPAQTDYFADIDKPPEKKPAPPAPLVSPAPPPTHTDTATPPQGVVRTNPKQGDFFGDLYNFAKAQSPAVDWNDHQDWLTAIGSAIRNTPDRFKQLFGGELQGVGETPSGVLAGYGATMPGASGAEAQAVAQLIGRPELARPAQQPGAPASPELAQFGQKIYKAAADHIKANAPNLDPNSSAAAAGQVTAGLIDIVPLLAATYLTKNPTIPAALMGNQAWAEAYGAARESGRTAPQAAMDAGFSGVMNSTLGLMPLGELMKPGQTFLGKTLKSAVNFGLFSVITEALQTGYDKLLVTPDMTLSQAWDRVKQAGITGVLQGAFLGAGHAGLEHAVNRLRNAGPPPTGGGMEALTEAAAPHAESAAGAIDDAAELANAAMEGRPPRPRPKPPMTPMPPTTALEDYAARAPIAQREAADQDAADAINRAMRPPPEAQEGRPPPEAIPPAERTEAAPERPHEPTEAERPPGKWDFENTFPEPQDEELRRAGRNGFYDEVAGPEGDQHEALASFHAETEREAAGHIAQIQAADEALHTGKDPVTGKAPKSDPLMRQFEQKWSNEANLGVMRLRDLLGSYHDYFGPEATLAFNEHLLDRYDPDNEVRNRLANEDQLEQADNSTLAHYAKEYGIDPKLPRQGLIDALREKGVVGKQGGNILYTPIQPPEVADRMSRPASVDTKLWDKLKAVLKARPDLLEPRGGGDGGSWRLTTSTKDQLDLGAYADQVHMTGYHDEEKGYGEVGPNGAKKFMSRFVKQFLKDNPQEEGRPPPTEAEPTETRPPPEDEDIYVGSGDLDKKYGLPEPDIESRESMEAYRKAATDRASELKDNEQASDTLRRKIEWADVHLENMERKEIVARSEDVMNAVLKNKKKNWQGIPDAEINIIRDPETGLYRSRASYGLPNSGASEPFNLEKSFPTAHDALEDARGRLLEWLGTKDLTRSDSENKARQRIVDWAAGLKSPDGEPTEPSPDDVPPQPPNDEDGRPPPTEEEGRPEPEAEAKTPTEGEKRKPLKRYEDVGEVLEGRRKQAERDIGTGSTPKDLEKLLEKTREATNFRGVLADDATDGAHYYAYQIWKQLRSFMEYSGRQQGAGRKKWQDSFSKTMETSWRVDPERERSMAAQYIATMETLRDALNGARDVGSIHNALVKMFLTEDGLDTPFAKDFGEYTNSYYWRPNLGLRVFGGDEKPRVPFNDNQKVPDKSTPLVRPSVRIEDIQRIGLPDRRNGKDVEPEDFRKAFGFRGVEFGNWVTGKEGRLHVNAAFDALHDMADLLGIPPQAISLGGRLGLAFGARGRGRHAAHFEPDTDVINLTKTKGDGSLAHEWAHALDYTIRKGEESVNSRTQSYLKAIRNTLSEAWSTDGALRQLDSLLKGNSWISGAKSMHPIKAAEKYVDHLWYNNGWGAKSSTEYKRNAKNLDGGNIAKPYWANKEELWARSLESYIYDKLAEAGQLSPYLVNDFVADGNVTKEAGYRGTPYPAGEERQNFRSMWDAALAGLKWDENGLPSVRSDFAGLPDGRTAVEDALKAIDLPARYDQLRKEREAEANARLPGFVPPKGPSALEGAPSEGGGAAESAGETGGESGRPGPTDRGLGELSDEARQRGEAAARGESEEGGVGADNAGVGRDEGDSAKGRTEREGDRAERGLRGQNYRINPDEPVATGSPRVRVGKNIKAIEIAQRLVASGENATADEQKALAQFVGWGGLPKVFDEKDTIYEREREQLKALLTPEEYDAARLSTINAHYTSPDVVKGMWEGLKKLGFPGGHVLEPGMGVGNFLGLVPDDLAGTTRFTGVELDPLTAKIARGLYPEADVINKPFEEAALPEGSFDAVIGNVPFADYKPFDPLHNPKRSLNLHNYFIHKAVALMKPGGIGAVITSRYTLDSKSDAARKMIDKAGGELIGAIRLPDTAFKGNAGTEVVADILVFRKRDVGEKADSGDRTWLGASEHPVASGAAVHNDYFAKHPENVLGTPALIRGMHRENEYSVTGPAEKLGEQINDAFDRIKKEHPLGFAADLNATTKQHDSLATPPDDVKDGAYFEKDGKIYRRIGERGIDASIPDGAKPRVSALIKMRDAARETLARQREVWDGKGKEPWADAQKRLNTLYDKFVKDYGPINKVTLMERKTKEGEVSVYRRYPNLARFDDDPDTFLTAAIENYDEETGKASKAPIMSQRVLEPEHIIEHADSPEDALIASMNMKGGVDLGYMGKLLGVEPDQVARDLPGRIFKDPSNGKWHLAEGYLSGDVRNKLAVAKKMALVDKAFQPNVDALEAVQPADLAPSQISARIGVPWIPKEDIRNFIQHLLGSGADVYHVPSEALWKIRLWDEYSVGNRRQWAAGDIPAKRLIEDALNQKPTVVTYTDPDGKTHTDQAATVVAQEKQNAIKEEFERWIWDDADRAQRLSRFYNDNYNNLALPTFNGDHLTLPGSSSIINLRTTQKKAVWRYLVNGNTLLDHVVGAGKTFTAIASAMEAKRLGLLKKPLFSVPNHMLEQFSREYMQMYPGAHILVASKEEFSGDARRQFVAKAATGNWDAIIMTHSSFERVPMSKTFQARFLERQIEEYEQQIRDLKKAEGGRDPTVKQLENTLKKRTEKLKDLIAGKGKDRGLTFEDMGVDGIFVDEAHLFKNLEYVTKSRGNAGTPSQRAFDVYLKTRYIDEQTPGRGVMFMTGTSISNSMSEMFTMQRYLAPRMLSERGLSHFDAWAATFGDLVTKAELAPEGGRARLTTRFGRFRNIPELVSLYRHFADLVNQQNLIDTGTVKLPKVKGDKPQTHVLEPSDELRAFIQNLGERADAVREGRVSREEDNMLKVSTDGRKAAIDMRMVEPNLRPDPNRKAAAVAEQTYDIWKRTAAKKGTQLVFSDLSTPREDGGYSIYHDIRDELIKKGVPAGEIAFIHNADTDEKKGRLFENVRAGKVRVLLGSTEKMGVGTNVQKRLAAEHDVDAPWRPSDLEQRHGRIIRQGNDNDEVELHRYATEGSFDAYMWQTLERKARFINQIKNGDPAVRVAEDIDEQALSYAEVKALAAGNPLILEKAKIDSDVERLTLGRKSHHDNDLKMKWEVKGIPAKVESYERQAKALEADAETAAKFQKGLGEKKFEATIGKAKFDERAKAAKALEEAVLKAHGDAMKAVEAGEPVTAEKPIGEIGGFKVSVEADGESVPALVIHGKTEHEVELDIASPSGFFTRVENTIRRFAEQRQTKLDFAEKLKGDLEDLKKQIGKPWPKEDEYKAAIARQAEIDKQLGVGPPGTEPPKPPPRTSAMAVREEPGFGRRRIGGEDATWRTGRVQLTRDIIARMPPYPTEKEAEIIAGVDKLLRKITPTAAAYGARTIDVLGEAHRLSGATEGTRIGGVTHNDTAEARSFIAWSLESPDAIGTATHEALHYLRGTGRITRLEWAALEEASVKDDWIDKHDIDTRYENADPNVKREESIASEIEDWRRAPKLVPKPLRPIYEKIVRALAQTAAFVRKKLGMKITANEVFSRILSGEVGARPFGSGEFPPVFRERAQALGERDEEKFENKGKWAVVDRALGKPLDDLRDQIKTVIDRMPDDVKILADAAVRKITPMAAGKPLFRAFAKDFASTLRRIDDEHNRVDEFLTEHFDEQQQAAMYDAMDVEGVAKRTDTEAPQDRGFSSLTPEELATLKTLEANNLKTAALAEQFKMLPTTLEHYVPRMGVIWAGGEAIRPKVGEGGIKSGFNEPRGRNLTTTTPQMKKRKYTAFAETEAAFKKKFGDDAEIVRNIRTLNLADRNLQRAIAGRKLIENIAQAGDEVGEPYVLDADQLPTDHSGYFTMPEHPAFWKFEPRWTKDKETGKTVPLRDEDGEIVFDPKLRWVTRDAEGPLDAVLSQAPGAWDKAAMTVKGKAMSIIMYSPMIHNQVEYGRAFPAAPLKLVTPQIYKAEDGWHFGIQLYIDGHRAWQDPRFRRLMLDNGYVPIGRRGYNQDITAIAEGPEGIKPGRSITAKLLAFVPGLYDPKAGLAVKRGIDAAGKFWHETLLWNRIADLQAGLAQTMLMSFQKAGLPEVAAAKVAAFFANRYAGTMAPESMSHGTRSIMNWLWFSRNFTLGNLASVKDVGMGLPLDIQAQLERDFGPKVLQLAQGIARRKALTVVVGDLIAQKLSLAMGAAAVAALGYAMTGVWKYYDPADNEPGKENRVFAGIDSTGTATYLRIPFGKVSEDLQNWSEFPIGTRRTFINKLSPMAKFLYGFAADDKGFSRHIFDPNNDTFGGNVDAIYRLAGNLADSILPDKELGATYDLLFSGEGDVGANIANMTLPLATGVTTSKGYPGGPAAGYVNTLIERHRFEVSEALPGIFKDIRAGREDEAEDQMIQLGLTRGLIRYYLRVALSTGPSISKSKWKELAAFADPDQMATIDRMEAAQEAEQQGAAAPAP